jgi:hypothetical protein
MKTSVLFMLIVQGTVTVILGILFYKVLTIGKKKGKELKQNQKDA